jgi:hypothetical protein
MLGCHRNFFTAHSGYVATSGPAFGTWSSTPQGCSRDPKDALPDAQSRTAATFFWEDPADHNPMLRDHKLPHVPDAPDQFNLLHTPAGGYQVRLKTLQTDGTLIGPEDCTTFEVETHEQPPGFPAGRPTLGGTVNLECHVKGSEVEAHFTFDHCDY